jgi:hypothetical protein
MIDRINLIPMGRLQSLMNIGRYADIMKRRDADKSLSQTPTSNTLKRRPRTMTVLEIMLLSNKGSTEG